jgi:nucleotide-binding universal stress UspA family protein
MKPLKMTPGIVLLLALSCAAVVRAQTEEGEGSAGMTSAIAQKQLASRDPLTRQRAAEELARLASPADRKLLEGYRLQEKNARAKLALDWALYRIGKTDALFAVVRALDSPRAEQAKEYLSMLEHPGSLYLFLERANGITQIKLLEVLAKIGDAGSVEKIKPYRESFDPKVAEAAQLAAREIEQRLGAQSPENSTRPRQVGGGENSP